MEVFTITNAVGVELRFISYGGILLSLKVPDRNGELGDVVLGYESLHDYLSDNPYFGAIIGRYCNRIANGHSDSNRRDPLRCRYSVRLHECHDDRCAPRGG